MVDVGALPLAQGSETNGAGSILGNQYRLELFGSEAVARKFPGPGDLWVYPGMLPAESGPVVVSQS